MAFNTGTLITNVVANTSGFTRGMGKARGELTRTQKATKSLGTVMGKLSGIMAAMGVSIGMHQILRWGQEALRLFQKQEAAVAQLNSTLEATGGAAGLTSQQIQNFAAMRQELTGIGDEATIAGAAILGTFKEISGPQFTRALTAMQDLAVKMAAGEGGPINLKSAAIQLGKALNDPITGMAAMRRVGVSFTEDQIKMAKALVANGDLIQAQILILQELESQFGGAAEARGKTLTGELDKMNSSVGDLKESLGALVAPGVTELAKTLNEAANGWRLVIQNADLLLQQNPVLKALGLFQGGGGQMPGGTLGAFLGQNARPQPPGLDPEKVAAAKATMNAAEAAKAAEAAAKAQQKAQKEVERLQKEAIAAQKRAEAEEKRRRAEEKREQARQEALLEQQAQHLDRMEQHWADVVLGDVE